MSDDERPARLSDELVAQAVQGEDELRHFVETRGKIQSRDDLLNAVWGYDAMPTTRTVDVHVAGLRKKLEPNPRVPQFILTLHGLGYKFVG